MQLNFFFDSTWRFEIAMFGKAVWKMKALQLSTDPHLAQGVYYIANSIVERSVSGHRPYLLLSLCLFLALAACGPEARPRYTQLEIQQTVEIMVGLTAQAQNNVDFPPSATAPPSDATTTEDTTQSSTPALPAQPEVVVVFTPGGLFDAAKRAEFYARIINPYIDYYAELAAAGQSANLVSINIQSFDTPDYPYGADAIFDNEGYEGWLIAETAGVVNLWVPDCMNGPCPISQEFIDKYPDSAATIQAQ